MRLEAMAGAPNSPGCQAVSKYTGTITDIKTHPSDRTKPYKHPPSAKVLPLPIIKHVMEPDLRLHPAFLTLHLLPQGPSSPLSPPIAVEGHMVPILHMCAASPAARIPLSHKLSPVPDLTLARPHVRVVS